MLRYVIPFSITHRIIAEDWKKGHRMTFRQIWIVPILTNELTFPENIASSHINTYYIAVIAINNNFCGQYLVLRNVFGLCHWYFESIYSFQNKTQTFPSRLRFISYHKFIELEILPIQDLIKVRDWAIGSSQDIM